MKKITLFLTIILCLALTIPVCAQSTFSVDGFSFESDQAFKKTHETIAPGDSFYEWEHDSGLVCFLVGVYDRSEDWGYNEAVQSAKETQATYNDPSNGEKYEFTETTIDSAPAIIEKYYDNTGNDLYMVSITTFDDTSLYSITIQCNQETDTSNDDNQEGIILKMLEDVKALKFDNPLSETTTNDEAASSEVDHDDVSENPSVSNDANVKKPVKNNNTTIIIISAVAIVVIIIVTIILAKKKK